jgi:hypothetical protein
MLRFKNDTLYIFRHFLSVILSLLSLAILIMFDFRQRLSRFEPDVEIRLEEQKILGLVFIVFDNKKIL